MIDNSKRRRHSRFEFCDKYLEKAFDRLKDFVSCYHKFPARDGDSPLLEKEVEGLIKKVD